MGLPSPSRPDMCAMCVAAMQPEALVLGQSAQACGVTATTRTQEKVDEPGQSGLEMGTTAVRRGSAQWADGSLAVRRQGRLRMPSCWDLLPVQTKYDYLCRHGE